ncbi:MAG: Methyltransferase domain protein [Bacteroidetes bacterium]|jgi:SAM-dependent methyltransferase|nr:Methyltransferase domain protein [Bacteroidota bacterium]
MLQPLKKRVLRSAVGVFNTIEKNRYFFSSKYLRGQGIEIGGLHMPLQLPAAAKVKYVDRYDTPGLRKHYPELASYNLVNVQIIDDGEKLATVPDNSQDFIIANHMLEHCKSPITTIETHLRKVKPGGVLFYAIPDKRFCPDKDRNLTTFDHLLSDYRGELDHYPHFEEWAIHWNECKGKEAIDKRAKELFDTDYSIHFHNWTVSTFGDFLYKTNDFLSTKFEVKLLFLNFTEVLVILERVS